MPLSLDDQYNSVLAGWTEGDFDRLSRVLTDPDVITPQESFNVAQSLGMKKGMLSAAVNIVADPTVWIAMMLSRNFPTAQFLKGTVPHRFIGASNEFTGLSTVARTVEGFFRGTNIPKLVSLKMKRETEVFNVGTKIFDDILIRPNWKEEMPIVSLLLEGQNPTGATPELRTLSQKIRGHMEEMWGFLKKTQKVEGGFDSQEITRATARDFTAAEAPRHLRDYLPHIPLYGDSSTIEISGRDALARFGRNRTAQVLSATGADPNYVWRADAADRLGSNFQRYQSFMEQTKGQVFNPRLFPRHRYGIDLESTPGKELFVTDLNIILQKYIHTTARTYALNAPLSDTERALASQVVTDARGMERRIFPSRDPIIVQIINQGLDTTGGKMVQRQVVGTNVLEEVLVPGSVNHPALGALRSLVRNVQGKRGEDEILFGNVWNSIRAKLSEVAGAIGMGPKEKLAASSSIDILESQSYDREVNNRLTSFFYATTLGFNFRSAFKNLFQPFLTTAPAIGLGPTLEGYKTLKSRLPEYAHEVLKQNRALSINPNIPFAQRVTLAVESAYRKVFPEMAEAGIRPDPRAFELSDRELIEDALTGRTKFRKADAWFKFILQPFTQSEMSNQAVSFYGGKAALRGAIRRGELELPEGLGAAELDRYLNFEASNLVNATQFRPGPGSRTVLQSMLPTPFRQYSSFPVRLMNFFAESTVRGAMTDAQLQNASAFERLVGGRNWGTVARTYLSGRVLTEGFRQALGVDLSDAVGLTGPFTGIAQSGNLPIPIPIAPLPSLVMATANFAATRDVKTLQPMTLPFIGDAWPIPKVLVPGGVALSRAIKAVRSFRPDLGGFMDEDERLMYRGNTTDLILNMFGIPMDRDRRLRQVLDQTQANRLRVRDYRRKYAVAARAYDFDRMDSLKTSFHADFKGQLGELGITPQDLRRYDQQARLTSAQRLIRSMGRSASYLEAQLYETDPELVSEP